MKQITALLLSFVSFSSLAFNLSVNSGSSCTLFEESTIFETKLTSPCNWAVNAQGDLQTLSVKGNKVAILLGQPIPSNQAEKWGVSVEQNCSLESVGVMIDEVSKVIAVSKPLEGALLCPVLPIDHVFFKSYNWSL
ncbi:hypothetical protein LA064_002240 [Vibrio alginolyticus]|nr:hypothetical protein [Vibrio alginolyticus]